MSKPLPPIALFRLMVLGPLASRGQMKRGEVKAIIKELASQTYHVPDSRRTHLSEETIARWYYDWKRGGIEALVPKSRDDKGKTHLSLEAQTALLSAKKDNPARSLNTLIDLLERQGVVGKQTLARATVHRFLRQNQISKRILPDRQTIERRSFVAEHAGENWQGDVLHGPSIQISNKIRKTYLISLMDDASRLITHSAFCLGETALDIEGVLKQGVLKRGIPFKLILDNGSGYRAGSLQSICALLDIRLIYCPAYEPEGKGKLERFHRTFREQFLNEIDFNKIIGLDELNARLWAWIEFVYHRRSHDGLQGKTPMERWGEDLVHIRALGTRASRLDDIFYHRHKRTVHKNGTVSWDGKHFEVPYEHVGEKIILVVDPHTQTAIRIESIAGNPLGPVTPLDMRANCYRKRQRPHVAAASPIKQQQNPIELAYKEYSRLCQIPTDVKFSEEDNDV